MIKYYGDGKNRVKVVNNIKDCLDFTGELYKREDVLNFADFYHTLKNLTWINNNNNYIYIENSIGQVFIFLKNKHWKDKFGYLLFFMNEENDLLDYEFKEFKTEECIDVLQDQLFDDLEINPKISYEIFHDFLQ